MPDITEHSLYNGEVTIQFYEKSHRYKVNGEWIPSVTTKLSVLNKRLEQWAVNQAIDYLKTTECHNAELEVARYKWTEKKDSAAQTGTSLHSSVEQYIRALIDKTEFVEPLLLDEADINCWKAFKKFLAENPNIKFLESERLVYSRNGNYVGTFDILYEKNGKTYLGDFKTSSGIYKEYLLQCMAYGLAFNEETHNFIDGISIIRFDKKTGEYELFEMNQNDNQLEMKQLGYAWEGLNEFQSIYSKMDKWLK